jgi:hypothetical protein
MKPGLGHVSIYECPHTKVGFERTRFDIATSSGCPQDASPKAAAGLSSSDEEALRQKVVLPEIQRLLQAEREANEEVRWPIHHQKRGLRVLIEGEVY